MKDILRKSTEHGFAHPGRVRFQDVDAAGIVFYAHVLAYFHDAYVAWLEAAGIPLPELLEAKELALPLTHAEADYFRPLRFGDRYAVELAGHAVRGEAFELAYRVRLEDGVVAAVGRTEHAAIDPVAFRRAALSPAVRAALATLPPLPGSLEATEAGVADR